MAIKYDKRGSICISSLFVHAWNSGNDGGIIKHIYEIDISNIMSIEIQLSNLKHTGKSGIYTISKWGVI